MSYNEQNFQLRVPVKVYKFQLQKFWSRQNWWQLEISVRLEQIKMIDHLAEKVGVTSISNIFSGKIPTNWKLIRKKMY